MAKYKIIQKEEECIGCGKCIDECEENWYWKEENILAVPKKYEIDETELDGNKIVETICPVQCVKIEKIEE